MPSTPHLRAYLRVQSDVDRRIEVDLERAARDAERHLLFLGRQIQGPGVRTRSAQIRRTITELRAGQRDLWRGGVLPAILAGRERMVEEAQDLDDELRHVLYSRIPDPDDARRLETTLNETAREGMRQYLARRPVGLSARVYRNQALASGAIERRIRSALARGLPPREFAAEVRRYISPTVRGGVSYAAMRLARTEIAAANRERQIENGRRPGVRALRWTLSESHPLKDICDERAGTEYQPDDAPQIGHPNCLCQLVNVMDTPRQVAQAFERGDFDNEIERRLAARRASRS